MLSFIDKIIGSNPPALDRGDPLGTVCQYVHGNPTPINDGWVFPIRNATPEFQQFVNKFLAKSDESIAFKPDPSQQKKITLLEMTGQTAQQLRDRLTKYRIAQKADSKDDMNFRGMVGNGNRVRQNSPDSIYSRVVGKPAFDPMNKRVTVTFDLQGVDHWIGEVIDATFPTIRVQPVPKDFEGPPLPRMMVKAELKGEDFEKFSQGYAAYLVRQAGALSP